MSALALDEMVKSKPLFGSDHDSYGYDEKRKLYLPDSVKDKEPKEKESVYKPKSWIEPSEQKQAPIYDIKTKKQTGGDEPQKDGTFWTRMDSRLENLLKPPKEKPGLANRTDMDEKSTGKKILWDIAKYTPMLAGQIALFGPKMVYSTGITAAGLAFGNIADMRKKKKKVTWNHTRRELHTGNVLGLGEYAAFSTPEYLMKATPGIWPAPAMTFSLADIPIQIGRTLLFNPLLVVPFQYTYKTWLHFRDKVGIGPTIGGLMTGRIFKYLKDSHREGVMPTYKKDTKSVIKTLWPLHFFQLNYISDPTLRMVQSLFVNNPIFRYLNRDKTGETGDKYKQSSKSGLYLPDKKPMYQPGKAA